jgi:hypothetical protein
MPTRRMSGRSPHSPARRENVTAFGTAATRTSSSPTSSTVSSYPSASRRRGYSIEMVNNKETDLMATYRGRCGEEVMVWA